MLSTSRRRWRRHLKSGSPPPKRAPSLSSMTAPLVAAVGRPWQRVRVLPLAVAATALLLAACLWSWRGELRGRWQPVQLDRAEEPAGVCAAAVASRAAAAEAAAVKAGAPPLKHVEAEVVAQQCSDDFRAAAYQNGTKGVLGPPLMARGCPLEQVGAALAGCVRGAGAAFMHTDASFGL